jgi:PKD repeat protein
MTVNTSGNYTFELNEKPIESVFSSFNVTIIVGNKILYLTEGQNDVHTYLSNGTYQVQVKVSYQVSQNPEGNGVQDKPLIIVKLYQGDNSPDHSTSSSQGDSDSGSGYGSDN